MAITLKRLYHRTPSGDVARDANGTPQVSGVKVVRAGTGGRRQHFTPAYIQGGVAEGWLSLGSGRITIHAVTGDVVYQIVRPPGAYCCFCESALPDAGVVGPSGQTAGRTHVRTLHGEDPSPDPSNPSGYRVEAHYTTVLCSDPVDTLTPAQAAELDRAIRQTLAAKVRGKYGPAARRGA